MRDHNRRSGKVPKYLTEVAKRRKAAPDADELATVVQRAMANGWTQPELTQIFDCHHQQIYRWANRDLTKKPTTEAGEELVSEGAE